MFTLCTYIVQLLQCNAYSMIFMFNVHTLGGGRPFWNNNELLSASSLEDHFEKFPKACHPGSVYHQQNHQQRISAYGTGKFALTSSVVLVLVGNFYLCACIPHATRHSSLTQLAQTLGACTVNGEGDHKRRINTKIQSFLFNWRNDAEHFYTLNLYYLATKFCDGPVTLFFFNCPCWLV